VNETAPQGAAFFDLDRTLISGSSVFALGRAAYRHGMMPTRDLIDDAMKTLTFVFRGASDEKAEAVKNRVLMAIEGVAVDDMRALGEDIIPKLEGDVRREARGLVDLHHDAGRDTYIVSASPIEIVGDFADAIGLTGGVGTVAEIRHGVYTGKLAEPFCYGEGKADAIRKLARERGYDLTVCYAYSDSLSDLPMLDAVGHPIAVNPDRGLETVALQRGWPIVEFSRTRKKVVKRTTAAIGSVALAGTAFAIGWAQGKRAARPAGLFGRITG
jgi:HAD superfamily hydrolase (TIGR01490 family)